MYALVGEKYLLFSIIKSIRGARILLRLSFIIRSKDGLANRIFNRWESVMLIYEYEKEGDMHYAWRRFIVFFFF